MRHQFTKGILLINDAFDKSDQLVALLKKKNSFKPALVASAENDAYQQDTRTNTVYRLDAGDPDLKPYADELAKLIEKAVSIYKQYNPHVYGGRLFGLDVLKYSEGEKFDEHVDVIYGNPNFQNRQISVLIYLSDDYEGGETKFRQQELQVKPPKGSLAMFPPFYTHPHSGETVLKGTKYVIVTWLY